MSKIELILGKAPVTTEQLERERGQIIGFAFPQDRWWVLHGPAFDAKISDYNWELTGFDSRLAEIDPKIFVYGGNAYYITTRWIAERGWTAEALSDQCAKA